MNRREQIRGVVHETEYRVKMIKEWRKKKHWVYSINDNFNSGYPDMRIKVEDYPHIDVELKVWRGAASTLQSSKEVNSGLRKLQKIEIRDMNKAGVPAVCAVYLEVVDLFVFTLLEKFNPHEEIMAGMTVEGNGGKPDAAQLVRGAFTFLKQKGYNYYV